MPIKSCTRCGLKVLVDASQAASDTYLCPRCVGEAKGAGSTPKPAAPAKRSSVKVLCPYCGASFSGTMPSRPAKGGCPVCQKELVLLPDGTIQAATTFNLAAWQKQRDAKKSEPAGPPPAPTPAEPVASDTSPIGGSTILDMGGPPVPASALPTLDEGPMEFPGGLGGETMLGMGGSAAPPAPSPSIDEPAPAPPGPEPEREDVEPSLPDDLGGATILDMGPRPVEMPPPDVEERPPQEDLLRETMPGMDRPPAAESPVPEPTPPPIPEEMAAEPEPEPEPAQEPEPEPSEASLESAPELPSDLGGQTILGMGSADDMPPKPESVPTIEEAPPEAVPILAKDVAPVEPMEPEPPAAPPESAAPAKDQPYVYQPVARTPRKSGASMPPPAPATAIVRTPISSGSMPPPPPPPSSSDKPVLGSDFRIATAPPPPKSPPSEPAREAVKAAGPKTSQVDVARPRPNMVRVVTAWIILAVPVAVGFGLYTMQKAEPVAKIIRSVTDQVLPGFKKMDEEIRKAVTKPAETPAETK